MKQVQQAARSGVVLVGVMLGTVAAVAVVLGIGALGLIALGHVIEAYDIPLVSGD